MKFSLYNSRTKEILLIQIGSSMNTVCTVPVFKNQYTVCWIQKGELIDYKNKWFIFTYEIQLCSKTVVNQD